MRLATCCLALFCLLFSLGAQSTNMIDAYRFSQQRKVFQRLYKKAQQGELKLNDPALYNLKSYPLYPYILAAHYHYRLDHEPGIADDRAIADYLKKYTAVPTAPRLRIAWLRSLSKRNRWELVVRYTHESDSPRYQCQKVHARIKLGQQPKQAALDLWRVGHSQPGACDPVFAWLEDQNLLADKDILKRAHLAILQDQSAMAHRLAKRLSKQQRQQIKHWIKAARDLSDSKNIEALPEDILFYAFQRYALQDTDKAAKDYDRLVKQFAPSQTTQYAMKRYLALLYAQDQQADNALAWFDRINRDKMDDHARAWAVRTALYENDWQQVIKQITAMPLAQSDRATWRYWLARALEATGRRAQAHLIFKPLAQQRSYYGYLAAERLGLPYHFGHDPLTVDKKLLVDTQNRPYWQRAHELYALDMKWQFRSEWYSLISHSDTQQLKAIAQLAAQKGWPSRAIIALAKANYWDDLDIRFPLPYQDIVKGASQAASLDPAYIYAIMRNESLFNTTTRSPVGAVGLMQIMPTTARHVAQDHDLKKPSSKSLTRPETNINLGSLYLRKLLDQFDQNMVLATAAYNSGPNAVKRWLNEGQVIPADIWIANIAYTETRKYVQHILYYLIIYRHRMGQPIRSIQDYLEPVKYGYN